MWNATEAAMTAGDIIQLNARQLLDAILVYSSSDEISREVFKHCRNLKVVSRHGVGIENIDVSAKARSRGANKNNR